MADCDSPASFFRPPLQLQSSVPSYPPSFAKEEKRNISPFGLFAIPEGGFLRQASGTVASSLLARLVASAFSSCRHGAIHALGDNGPTTDECAAKKGRRRLAPRRDATRSPAALTAIGRPT
jgi:hypothetical protein